jgi:alpha-beta hydrolase superfamily lysophospholipase
MIIEKIQLNYQEEHFTSQPHALLFLPDQTLLKKTMAICCHGYTSDKSSLLNWANRLVEVGVPVCVFDLPGHYLGSYEDVQSFEGFTLSAPSLFQKAYEKISEKYPHGYFQNLILGGHSLGALLALQSLERDLLHSSLPLKTHLVLVGLGMAPKHVVHLFDTPFYQATLKFREQLVSPHLKADNVFPWIKEAKENLTLKNHHIHLITGHDDLVVGSDGAERLKDQLEALGNVVTLDRPTKLPHHEPGLASSHIKKYFKDLGWI